MEEFKVNKKKTNTKTIKRTKKISKAITYILIMMVTCCSSFGYASAAPAGVDTSTLDTLVEIILWIARVAIIAYSIPAGFLKVVDGRSQERPSEVNAGLVTIVICGACFAATFAIPSLLSF